MYAIFNLRRIAFRQLVTIVLFLTALGLVIFSWLSLSDNSINAQGNDMSYLEGLIESAQSIDINLRFGNKRWRIRGSELEINSDIHTVILDMYRRKGYKTYQQKLDALKNIQHMGFSSEVGINYLFPALSQRLDDIIKQIDLEPVPADLVFKPNRQPMFSVIRDKVGFKVDKNRLLNEIEYRFRISPKIHITVKPQILRSAVNSKAMSECTYLRSRFSTDYTNSSPQRKHNVALALSRFNGLRVEPNQIVSFNKIVGRRTESRGFLEAKIIKNGQYEDGVGGGVCQSSTTLYNGALLADMEILQVSQHSLSISYIEPSFDAMVNSGTGDLVFRNTAEFPVFIKTYANENKVFVEFYGTRLNYRIERESRVTEKIPALKDEEILDTKQKHIDKVRYRGEKVRIQSPKEGLKSQGYLCYYDFEGNLIERKLIRKNTYKPQKGIVVEGIEIPQEIVNPVQ